MTTFETNHGTRYAFVNSETGRWQATGSYMSAETIEELRVMVEREFHTGTTVYREGSPGYSEACGVWD